MCRDRAGHVMIDEGSVVMRESYVVIREGCVMIGRADLQ